MKTIVSMRNGYEEKSRSSFIIWLVVLMALILSLSVNGSLVSPDNPVTVTNMPSNQPLYVSHPPIRIDSNADFATIAALEGWFGDGSQAYPWIINNYNIYGDQYCLYIGNTTDYFIVRNSYFHGAKGNTKPPYYPGAGLVLNCVKNGQLLNNTISSNRFGVYIENFSSYNIIANNKASGNINEGIKIWNSHNNTVFNNTLKSNYWFGISLSNSNDNDIFDNNASNNQDSYRIVSSNNNTITNNTASSNNAYGIFLHSSNGNTISNNKVYKNTLFGIYLVTSSNNNTVSNNTLWDNWYGIRLNHLLNQNKIYHNYIINNTYQAYDYEVNIWDNGYPSGGNYWSDYDGVDLYSGPGQNISGSDGIGDTPYTNITGGTNIDNYPLMKPWVVPESSNDTVDLSISEEDITLSNPNPQLGETVLISATVHNNNEKVVNSHLPIRINSNADFDAAHGVSGGNGSESNPWIIENYDINGTGYGYCLFIGNTTDHFIVRNCRLHNANGTYSYPIIFWEGLYLYNVRNGIVDNNSMFSNWIGIHVRYSDHNLIMNNMIANYMSGSNLGIRLINSDFNLISGNGVSYTYFGIGVGDSCNNTIFNNYLTNNAVGISIGKDVAPTNYNVIINNTALNNTAYGITVHGYKSTITGNYIFGNNRGIDVIGLNDVNYAYHNTIVNNTHQAHDDGFLVQWDDGYPSGGNYWSDYTGYDNYSGPNQDQPGSDGIGDTPYTNIWQGQDNYPLMIPIGNGAECRNFTFDFSEKQTNDQINATCTVSFYIDNVSTRNLIHQELNVPVPGGGNTTVFTNWTANVSGNHSIIVVVSDVNPPDSDLSNNTASVNVFVQNPSTATATGPQGANHDPIITLTYDWTGTPSVIDLFYSTNNGECWNFLGTDTTVDGVFNWGPASNPAPKPSKYYWIANAQNGTDDVGIPANGTPPEAGPFNWKTWDTCKDAPQPLYGGSSNWFFISVPINISGDLMTTFNDTNWGDGGTTWDYIQWYEAADTSDPWKSFSIYRPASLNDNVVVDNTKGFWIHLTANNGDGVLTVGKGSEPGATSIPLYAGWNLVGYPSMTEMTVSDAFWGSGVDRVEIFDPSEPYRTREVGPSYIMKPGEGYWVHVATDSLWVVDW